MILKDRDLVGILILMLLASLVLLLVAARSKDQPPRYRGYYGEYGGSGSLVPGPRTSP
jgi:hypothetical protein